MTDYFTTQLPADEIRGISSIGLAHLGDGVYELLVRTWLCAHGKATGKALHRCAAQLVCAPKQAELAERILPELTEEEQAEHQALRREYVQSVLGNLDAHLANTYLVDEHGNKRKLRKKGESQ